jgi:hypothetical protein
MNNVDILAIVFIAIWVAPFVGLWLWSVASSFYRRSRA